MGFCSNLIPLSINTGEHGQGAEIDTTFEDSGDFLHGFGKLNGILLVSNTEIVLVILC